MDFNKPDVERNNEDSIDNAENKKNSKDHFESTYKLKPNEKYEAKGYQYETDKYGRITRCEGSLRLEEGKRNTDHQVRAGGEFRLEKDEGGHLIGRRFGGSEKIDNLVPMDHHVNGVVYKELENDWANELEKGNKVDVKISCRYSNDSLRPNEFVVKYSVTDENGFSRNEVRRIPNRKE